MVKHRHRARVCVLAIPALMLAAQPAQAHVKWFCGVIDPSLPPATLGELLVPLFGIGVVVFALLVAIGALVDSALARRLPGASATSPRAAIVGEVILRLGMALYFFLMWHGVASVQWAAADDATVLTPELLNSSAMVGWLQLATALVILVPPLSIVGAIGIALLYAIGASAYGVVYMIDYLFFLGAAGYLALSDPRLRCRPKLVRWRGTVLTLGIAFSLMWTAVEKFLYPQWTIAVLLDHPDLTAGYPFATVATIAGLVEFSLAFYLLVGREILGRASAVLLLLIFSIAMPEFGMVDVVGHVSVIAILLVVIVHGETDLQRTFRGGGEALVPAARVGGLFVVALGGLIALYYAMFTVSQGV